jgi:hypothetical protein
MTAMMLLLVPSYEKEIFQLTKQSPPLNLELSDVILPHTVL